MLVGCPRCRTRYRIDDSRVQEGGIKLRCGKCTTLFRVAYRPAAPTAAPPPSQPAGPAMILVAQESPSFCEAVKGVLADEPFSVVACHDGAVAWETVLARKPAVALVDVALPGIFGFELCERIKNDPRFEGTKVILIAAIYDKTRYKRHPSSLYGADDYIEKHHIPDSLVSKLYRLLSGQKAADEEAPDEAAAEERVEGTVQQETSAEQERADEARKEIRRDEEECPVTGSPAEVPESHLKARRLARIIVSDIALYNQAKVEEGVRSGTLLDLLEADIAEGRKLYEKRIPEEVRNVSDYLGDAFRDLEERIRKDLNL